MKKNNNIVIYQAKNGAIELKGDLKKETLWASQTQIVELFGVDQSVVSRHIKNIFKDNEVVQKSNMQKMHIPNSDKPVTFYSLDVVLSVGYRTNSNIAIQFRKWATKTLRTHIVDGYTINPSRIGKNYEMFLQAVEDVKKLLPTDSNLGTSDALELVKMFAGTWFSLDAYDKSSLPTSGLFKKQVDITAEELLTALAELKHNLLTRGEATELFGQEKKSGNLTGIVGNVFQSFGGEDLYPTGEEKAAHLLYFVIKNHPFNDGNKRSGAFAFVWFLKKTGLLDISRLSPEALTALTLLIAESNPKDKDRMVGLIVLILRKEL
ncbi:MAG: virulence protein RhuM/Fic/DOC family protein [Candidatus Peregrinibacteria bacterium]|nr:virulence protein RhuM/Fic/DOC family protein [Candidatus Peregrinibacteria bacterium]MDZ4245385.1 virulence protein RhuM/Fic/DOC family protein [Candidatus Gracilibacteria bacterium]